MPECSIATQEVTQNREISQPILPRGNRTGPGPDDFLRPEVEHVHETLTLYCTKCGFSWVATLNCGDRTCLKCRRKWHGHHRDTLQRIIEGWGGQVRVLTLTLKNVPDRDFNKDTIRRLRKCFSRLIHRKYFKARIRGGFYVVHLTNTGRGFHPHLHIIYHGEYIPKSTIVKAWGEITGDSYIVNIKPMVSTREALHYLLGDLLQRPRIRRRDVRKYNEVLKGSRLIQGFGDYSRVSFREPFVCPMCGNDAWYTDQFEYREHGCIVYDTS